MTTARPSTDWNHGVIDDFRSHGGNVTSGPFVGRQLLLLTTRGAHSGEPRTVPLAYTRDGDRIVVVASKGGAPTNPDWFHNLVADPDVTIELPGETIAVTATTVDSPERERLYAAHAALHPTFNDYLKKTTRRIPVIALERAA